VTSWQAALVTILGATGYSMASSSLGNSCSFVMPMLRHMSSLDETSPAMTGMFDSLMFSNSIGFSPFAAMMPAISYSVETGFVILVSSPVFWSCSIKFLKPTLVLLRQSLAGCFLKNNRQSSFVLFVWVLGV